MKKHQQEILAKQQTLEEARRKLKQKFIGIDKQIDQVIDACTSWFLLPQYQDRPVIINLWGLTGTGKTALVEELMKHLSFENFFFPFDMSSGSARWQIDRVLDRFRDSNNGEPLVLLFDEFQNARTIDKQGEELRSLPLLWQLMDSGTYTVKGFTDSAYEVANLTRQLQHAIRYGVKAESGKVVKGEKEFNRVMQITVFDQPFDCCDKKEPSLFVESTYYPDIQRMDIERFEHIADLEEYLLSLNETESVNYLKSLVKKGPAPKKADCSKALIFVVGNLDEAYTMASDFSVEMDADAFFRASQEIDMLAIKNVLSQRFRSEHIARLGNNHILYPAFSAENYRSIITQKLSKIASGFQKEHQSALVFDESLHQLIYREGVYPSQGTRPVLSTVQNLVADKLGLILVEAFKQNLKFNKVAVSYGQRALRVAFTYNGRSVHDFEIPLFLNLERLREVGDDNLQALTAVHEAGHAVACIFAEGVYPELLKSRSIDPDKQGFIYVKRDKKYWSYQDKLNTVCTMLAGREAERLVFGPANLTTGAEGDLAKATALVSSMLRKSGMGRRVGSFVLPGEIMFPHLRGATDELEGEVQITLENASNRAREILEKEFPLFIKIAGCLADQSSLTKTELQELVREFSSESPVMDQGFAYRKKLMDQLSTIPGKSQKKPYFNQSVILNKNS